MLQCEDLPPEWSTFSSIIRTSLSEPHYDCYYMEITVYLHVCICQDYMNKSVQLL